MRSFSSPVYNNIRDNVDNLVKHDVFDFHDVHGFSTTSSASTATPTATPNTAYRSRTLAPLCITHELLVGLAVAGNLGEDPRPTGTSSDKRSRRARACPSTKPAASWRLVTVPLLFMKTVLAMKLEGKDAS